MAAIMIDARVSTDFDGWIFVVCNEKSRRATKRSGDQNPAHAEADVAAFVPPLLGGLQGWRIEAPVRESPGFKFQRDLSENTRPRQPIARWVKVDADGTVRDRFVLPCVLCDREMDLSQATLDHVANGLRLMGRDAVTLTDLEDLVARISSDSS